jgi:hypothetical protein
LDCGEAREPSEAGEENRVVRVATFALGVATGAFLLGVAVLLLGPWWIPATSELVPPIPRLSSDGPVVRNGVAAIVACGETKREELALKAVSAAPEPGTGTWGVERKGDCNVYYHHPPDASQREARHQRAQE